VPARASDTGGTAYGTKRGRSVVSVTSHGIWRNVVTMHADASTSAPGRSAPASSDVLYPVGL